MPEEQEDIITPQLKKKIAQRVWGRDKSLVSKITSIAALAVSLFGFFGYFTGCFDGCRDKFEENPKNKQQDAAITKLAISVDSLSKFREHQRKRNGQNDSIFKTLHRVRDNGIYY